MALKDYFPRWLARLYQAGSIVLGLHDALEDTFGEIDTDRAAMDADTVILEASDAGLDRWGTDLVEQRLPGQSTIRYAKRLSDIYTGKQVSLEGIRSALDKWDLPYQLFEFSSPSAFWDQGFYDTGGVEVGQREFVIVFGDPFGPYRGYWDVGFFDQFDVDPTPTAAAIADVQLRMQNAVNDAKRNRAAGVKVTAILPLSLSVLGRFLGAYDWGPGVSPGDQAAVWDGATWH